MDRRTITHQEAIDNLEAYVLGALEPHEADMMMAHIDNCPLCQEAERQLAAALGILGPLVPQVSPPPDLRERFLARLDEPHDGQTLDSPSDVVRILKRSRWARYGAVAAAGVALVLTGLSVSLQQDLSETRENLATVEVQMEGENEVLTGLGQIIPLTANNAPGAHGMLYLSTENHRALLVVDELPPAENNQVYQIWLVRDDHRKSAGVFTVDQTGSARVMIEADVPLDEYHTLGITAEPAPTGSLDPTGPHVVGCPLAAEE